MAEDSSPIRDAEEEEDRRVGSGSDEEYERMTSAEVLDKLEEVRHLKCGFLH